MDELEIKGKKYISSRRASELTGYAKDYIGQLARAGKIPGSRVGRAWYVEEEALLRTQGEVEKSSFLDVVEEKKPILSPLQPRPRISPTTLKMLGYRRRLPDTWSPARYFEDTADLRPIVSKEEISEGQIISIPEGNIIPIRITVTPSPVPPPRLPEISSKAISQKAKEIRAKRHPHEIALSFGAVTAALAVLLFFSSGLFLSSNFDINQSNGAYTANAVTSFEYIRDTFMKFPPFAEGVDSLGSFFSITFNSFYVFFDKGISFFLSLSKLIISLV